MSPVAINRELSQVLGPEKYEDMVKDMIAAMKPAEFHRIVLLIATMTLSKAFLYRIGNAVAIRLPMYVCAHKP